MVGYAAHMPDVVEAVAPPVDNVTREDQEPMFQPTAIRGSASALGAALLVSLASGAFAAAPKTATAKPAASTAPAKAPAGASSVGPNLRWQWTPATIKLTGDRTMKAAD